MNETIGKSGHERDAAAAVVFRRVTRLLNKAS